MTKISLAMLLAIAIFSVASFGITNSGAVVLSLKQTGQTVSYTDFDDGAYQKGVAHSYTRDDDKEIVIDNITGLIWQDNNDITSMPHSEAETYCTDLVLADYSDWRLPEIEELQSIINYGNMPMVNSTFLNARNSDFWSSTIIDIYGVSSVFNIFNNGYTNTHYSPSSHFSARCVRSDNNNVKQDQLTRDDTNGIVTDANTQLQWQDNYSHYASWQDAINYCEALSLGGEDDWRLPNINELISIIDHDVNTTIRLKKIFEKRSWRLWSSTTRPIFPNLAFIVNFDHGDVSPYYYKNWREGVRCVRNVQLEAKTP